MILGPIVGLDFSGVVKKTAKNDNTHDLKVGDEVYGTVRGSLATHCIVEANKIARKPNTLSFSEAAALPTAYLTGYQGLRYHGKLKSSQSVLILGASGGCGTAAVQLAKALGAKTIVGVCSQKNAALVKSLGCTETVDYKTEDFSKKYDTSQFEGFDVVYDCASGSGHGEDYKDDSFKVLKPTAPYVPLNGGGMMWTRFMIGYQESRVHLFTTKANRKDFESLAKLIDEHKLKPIIASKTTFNEVNVKNGFKLLKSRRAVGKIVFEMMVTTASQPVPPSQQKTPMRRSCEK
jgi:NADPH:quinone reductase-like Zn-dependent oxidoreductase